MKLRILAALATLSFFALVPSLNAQGVDVDAIRKSAEQGNATAQHNLGGMYCSGQGVTKDYSQAAIWFRKAAEQGFAPEQADLGALYQDGLGVAKDYAQAAIWLRRAADQGVAPAQDNMGFLYYDGQGVPKDYVQAATWFRKAADQGYAIAQDNLGNLYSDGHGVPQDYQQALAWYRKAANQGYTRAQDHLKALYASGHGGPQEQSQTSQTSSTAAPSSALVPTLPCTAAGAPNAPRAAQVQNSSNGQENDPAALDTAELRPRAIAGDARAQAELARRYDFGHGEGSVFSSADLANLGIDEVLAPQDYAQAFYWYRKAADQGLVEAQYELGRLYYQGHGVQKDYAQGFNWVAKAACQGYSTAQDSLGDSYQRGFAVSRDIEQALAWFRKAAGQQDDGAKTAQKSLGNMYLKGTDVPRDIEQGLAWYRKASDQGDSSAEIALGDMYANGTNVPPDYEQARLWYGKAAGHGDSSAKTKLEALNIQHPVVTAGGSTAGSHNGQNQQTSGSQAVPNILAMLDAAKSRKVELSGQDKKQITKQNLDHCNKNDYVWGDAWNTSNSCAIISAHLEGIVGLQSPAAETAYLRACAFTDTSRFHTNRCAKLGDFYERRGQLDLALAVYQHAPNCNQSFNFDKDRMGCLLGAARLLAQTGNATAARGDYQVLCKEYSDAHSCSVLNELGDSVDAKAAFNRSNDKDKADWDSLRERNRQYDEEAAERSREHDESLKRTMNTIQAVGQAVQDVTNQQTAANAALAQERQELSGQQRLAAQQAAQQPAANQNSSSHRQSGGAGGADSSAPGTGGRGGKSCVNATPEKGRWKLSNCAGEYENVTFAQPNAVTNGAVASGWHEDFNFIGGETYLSSGDSRYAYKIWACTGGSVPIDTATGTVPTYYSSNVECK